MFPPIYERSIDDGMFDVSGLLKIPKLKDGESCIMQIPWYPPDPKVASCTGDEGHYCILARIERDQDPTDNFGMDNEEITSVAYNVTHNNNIAWKNIQLDDPKKPLPGTSAPVPPCTQNPCAAMGEVIVGNANPTASTNTKLVFGAATDLQNLPATNLDKIIVDLGDQVHAKWVDGGKVGEGVIDDPCGPNMIDVNPTIGGWIGNITFTPDETDVIHLWALPSETAPFFPYKYHLDQFTTVPGLADEFVGGETFRGGCDSTGIPTPPADGDDGGGPAFKPTSNPKAAHQFTDLICTVHPNPASNSALVCIEDLAEGVPVLVEILNSLGEPVATLYNGTTEAEMGFCFRFNCSDLTNGTYYAHVIAGNLKRSVKLTVQH